MHATETTELTFHHNGDFSGRILVTPHSPQRPGDATPGTYSTTFANLAATYLSGCRQHLDVVEAAVTDDDDTACSLKVTVADLAHLIGVRIRDERIAALEAAEPGDLAAAAARTEVASWADPAGVDAGR